MDSFAINLENGTLAIDTSIKINFPNIKLTFDCSTNVDSINSNAFYRVSAIDSVSVYIDTLNNSISSLNRLQQIYIHGSDNFQLVIHLQATQFLNLSTFVRMKNIRALKQ